MNAQSYAIVAVGSATVIAAGSIMAQRRTPPVSLFIGGTVAAFMLSTAAGPLPGPVRALSTVIIIGTLLGSGYSLVEPLTKLSSSTGTGGRKR